MCESGVGRGFSVTKKQKLVSDRRGTFCVESYVKGQFEEVGLMLQDGGY